MFLPICFDILCFAGVWNRPVASLSYEVRRSRVGLAYFHASGFVL